MRGDELKKGFAHNSFPPLLPILSSQYLALKTHGSLLHTFIFTSSPSRPPISQQMLHLIHNHPSHYSPRLIKLLHIHLLLESRAQAGDTALVKSMNQKDMTRRKHLLRVGTPLTDSIVVRHENRVDIGCGCTHYYVPLQANASCVLHSCLKPHPSSAPHTLPCPVPPFCKQIWREGKMQNRLNELIISTHVSHQNL